MAIPLLLTLTLFTSIPTLSHAFIDLENVYTPTAYRPSIPTPTPHQIRDLFGVEFPPQQLQSMITAIAPAITMVSNGTWQTEYSVHYHDYFVRRNVGKGVFKRGVFASDPPLATCTPCGGVAATTSAAVNATTKGPTATCTLHSYYGVFRSNVGPQSAATSSYCYDSNYSGVLQPGTSTSMGTGLPCCFTIPASCLANYSSSMSMSMTYSSGVFRTDSSTFSSTFSSTVLSFSSSSQALSTTASPSSSKGLATALYTTSGKSSTIAVLPASLKSSSSSISLSLSFKTTKSASFLSNSDTSPISRSASALPNLQSTSPTPPAVYSAASSTASPTRSLIASSTASSAVTASVITSVTIISRSTLTVLISVSSSRMPTSTSQVTLSILTARPSTTTFSPYVTTLPNTVEGCGTASGSGTIEGAGTVYIGAGLIPVVSSGTVSGFASKVVGCGTLIATTGSFTGSATIIGCGSGSGTATMTGSGTVWPAALGGLVSFVSSGTVTGSGRMEGCGTMTGSGTFSAFHGIVKTITALPALITVEVFVSYCPLMNDMGPMGFGSNVTDSAAAVSSMSPLSLPGSAINATLAALRTNAAFDNPLCKSCPNDEGICCPLRVACNVGDGHCPWQALQGAGYVLNGFNVVAQQNSSNAIRRH